PVDFRMAPLAPEPLHLGNGNALDANGDERIAQLFVFVRADNRRDHAHRITLFIFETVKDEAPYGLGTGWQIGLLPAPAVHHIVELHRGNKLNSLVQFFHIQPRTRQRAPVISSRRRWKRRKPAEKKGITLL